MFSMTKLSEIRRLKIEDGLLVLLLLISLGGIFITDFSPLDGYVYWMIITVVFALMAVLIAWLQDKEKDLDEFTSIVKEQSLHWLSSLLCITGVYFLERAELYDALSSTLVIMLVLGLATILDGIRIGWRFSLVGLYLGASSIVIAYTDHYLIISSFLAIAIVAITISIEVWLAKKICYEH